MQLPDFISEQGKVRFSRLEQIVTGFYVRTQKYEILDEIVAPLVVRSRKSEILNNWSRILPRFHINKMSKLFFRPSTS